MEDQNSILTNINLCQSYLSNTQCSEGSTRQLAQLVSKQQEYEKTNNTLMATIDRYNSDLTQIYLENETLKCQLELLKLEQRKQNSGISVLTQTEDQQTFQEAETQTENELSLNSLTGKQKNFENKIKQLGTPKKKKSEIKSKNGSKNLSPNNFERNHNSATPEDFQIDCEYFESKLHLEKMIKKISTRVQSLLETVQISYPQILSKQTIIQSLSDIQSLIDYLKILLNDQLVEVKRFADQLNSEAAELIEEAMRIQQLVQQKQQDEVKFISYTEFTQNSSLNANEEYNLSQSNSSFVMDQNCTVINTSKEDSSFYNSCFQQRNEDYHQVDQSQGQLNNNKPLICNTNDFPKDDRILLQSEHFDNSIPQDTLNQSNYFFNKHIKQVKKQIIENKINFGDDDQNEMNFLNKSRNEEEYENNKFFQGELNNPENTHYDCGINPDNKKINTQQYSNQFYQEENASEVYDDQSQSENLLETLGDEEFDLEQSRNLFSYPLRKQKKVLDLKSQSERMNKIFTFSFGNHPSNIGNSEQLLQKIINQSQNEQSEFRSLDECNNQITKFVIADYYSFINTIQSILYGEQNLLNLQNNDISTNTEKAVSDILEGTRDCKQRIILSITKLAEVKKELEAMKTSSIVYSLNQEQLTESALEDIGESFQAESIQNLFNTKVKIHLNSRLMNLHKIKSNLANLKKLFGTANKELCTQYELYGQISAELMFIMEYLDSLSRMLSQITSKPLEIIRNSLIEQCMQDIDSLKTPKILKGFIEFVKSTIKQKITIYFLTSF